MSHFPYDLTAPIGSAATLGLIVLQADETVEQDFQRLFAARDQALYVTRIPSGADVTPETLRQMERDLPHAASLLPPSVAFSTVGYACTSGATMIGEACVDEMIRAVHPGARTSNPLTACKAALSALGLRRIALLTPYPPEVTLEMQANLRTAGFETVAVASFNQSDDFTVARISAQSILDAVATIGARDEVEGVFVSCTSLRALDVIAQAEARIGKPVIASNQVLAWHLMRLAGLDGVPEGAGRLFASG